MRILFAGGGSIGHIAPAVAVWRAIQTVDASSECFFFCSARPEDAEFLSREALPFRAIGPRSVNIVTAIPVFFGALSHLRRWKPDVIFTKGGGLTIPVALAAKLRGIPIVTHESDAVRGKGTRIISKWASAICLGFPESNEKLRVTSHGLRGPETRNPKPETFTGNPMRPEVTTGTRDQGLAITGLSGQKPILLVYGGSQGAAAINDAIIRHLDALLKTVDVVHLTGKGKVGAGKRPGYWNAEFAQDELPHLYAIADLALSRSGAGSISELAACGIATILIPLRGLAQDHQQSNAEAAAQSGGCIVLQQESLDQTLTSTIEQLAGDNERRKTMHDAIQTLHVSDAAASIANIVMNAALRR